MVKRYNGKEHIGATGKFPEGKLSPDDEGELKFAISVDGTNIIFDFGTPVTWLAFDFIAAEELVQKINHQITVARGNLG